MRSTAIWSAIVTSAQLEFFPSLTRWRTVACRKRPYRLNRPRSAASLSYSPTPVVLPSHPCTPTCRTWICCGPASPAPSPAAEFWTVVSTFAATGKNAVACLPTRCAACRSRPSALNDGGCPSPSSEPPLVCMSPNGSPRLGEEEPSAPSFSGDSALISSASFARWVSLRCALSSGSRPSTFMNATDRM